MREIEKQQPTQKMRSPFVAKVVFWNKSKYQNKFLEWNFRSDQCPNITKNSTIRDHLSELINFIKTNILRNYGFELCTIFENMNLLSEYGELGMKKNIVLQYSEYALFKDNRDKFDFDNLIKNNQFYIADTWNEEVMLISFNRNFISMIQRSFKEQSESIEFARKTAQKPYENYRNTWQIPYKNDMKFI